MMEKDSVSPFVPGVSVRIEGAAHGPLSGLTFAAKDLFDVAGFVTGGGNPDWACTHALPTRHAFVVERALNAGATLMGKTITDELSLGILGENPFFGTPAHPRDPQRVPGGSSSGSACAVANGLCDFALGTDTGGSVRVPASFCGLYGIRPSHGRIDVTGMMAQAPSSDTCGWFARDGSTFVRVSDAMMGTTTHASWPTTLLIAHDAFGIADESVQSALRPMLDRLGKRIVTLRERALAPPGLSVWARAQRTLQRHEAYQTFRDWIEHTNPRLAFSVARNLVWASTISASDWQWAKLMRDEARGRIRYLLRDGALLCLPTTPFAAPPRDMSLSAQATVSDRITCLTCHGGLTGAPQVSIPAGVVDGLPIGLSLVAAPGNDQALLALVRALDEE